VPFSILRPAWYLQNLFGAKAWARSGNVQHAVAGGHGVGGHRRRRSREGGRRSHRDGSDKSSVRHSPAGRRDRRAICRAVEAATGRKVAYYESTDGTRVAVESYPISDAHKDLYAELYDYFKRETFLGEPLEITNVIPGFTYGTIESFVQRNLYPAAEESDLHLLQVAV
jgi:hypothetical protein